MGGVRVRWEKRLGSGWFLSKSREPVQETSQGRRNDDGELGRSGFLNLSMEESFSSGFSS